MISAEGPNSTFAEVCDYQAARLKQFRDQHPDLDTVFSAVLNAADALLSSITLLPRLTRTEAYRWRLWQTVTNYQRQSLLLITAANTDAGFALLRLAAELARDVSVIADDDNRLNLWIDRRDRRQQREYRRLFRFNDGTNFGKLAHKTYDFCSDFGIHGHVSDFMNLEWIGHVRTKDGNQFLTGRVSDSGILSALQIWLPAFPALQFLCADTFLGRHEATLSEVYGLFVRGLGVTIEPTVNAIGRRLSETARSNRN